MADNPVITAVNDLLTRLRLESSEQTVDRVVEWLSDIGVVKNSGHRATADEVTAAAQAEADAAYKAYQEAQAKVQAAQSQVAPVSDLPAGVGVAPVVAGQDPVTGEPLAPVVPVVEGITPPSVPQEMAPVVPITAAPVVTQDPDEVTWS